MASADGIKTQRISRKTGESAEASSVPDGGYLQTVIDNLPVALFAKDAGDDFRFVLWNKEQERVTTIPREKALGKVDSEIFAPVTFCMPDPSSPIVT